MAQAKKEIVQEADETVKADGFAEDADAFEEEIDEVGILTAERDDMRDRFMRALADAENSRKRGERDRREAEQYGGSKLARDMLPVYDNLKRALDVAKGRSGGHGQVADRRRRADNARDSQRVQKTRYRMHRARNW